MKRFSQPVPAVPRQTVSRSGAKVEKENQRKPKNLTRPEGRPPDGAGRPFAPGKTAPDHIRSSIRKKISPGLRSPSFILCNRSSPVRLEMVLLPFIPPPFHHRMMSWKSQWTKIRSKARRERKRSQRIECPPERRWRLRPNQQEARPWRRIISRGLRSRPSRCRRPTSRQPASALSWDFLPRLPGPTFRPLPRRRSNNENFSRHQPVARRRLTAIGNATAGQPSKFNASSAY